MAIMTKQSDTYVHTVLTRLGLTQYQAQVYQVCLLRGEATIMELAKLTGITRTTVYGVADELVSRGLLRFIQKGAHRIYSAEDPKKLSILVDSTRRAAEEKAVFLGSVLPALSMQFAGATTKPRVSYYEGQAEVRQIYENFLTSGAKEVLFVGEATTIQRAVGEQFLKKVVKQRIKLNIPTRGIRTEATEVKEPLYDTKPSNLRKIRFAPKGFQSPTYIGIYLNKVFFISSIKESYGVLVESKDLSDTMRSWFEVLWRASKSR
jgi:sugar-specific transcriptional regulator TrmB